MQMINQKINIASWFIINYFFITALDGALNMFGYPSLCKFSLLLLFALVYISIKHIKQNGLSKVDLYVLTLSLIIVISSLSENYSTNLLWYGIRYQLLFMITGIIVGESSISINWSFIEKALLPICIVSLIGLYLFFTSPDWYINFRMSNTTNQNALFEMTRLSAFWEYPYWVSYGCAILYSFIIYRLFISQPIFPKYSSLLLPYLLLVILLAQQRVAIAFVIALTLFFLVYSVFRYKLNNKFFTRILIVGIALILLLLLIIKHLDVARIDFIIDRLNASERTTNESFISFRAGLYDSFFKKGISLFGDGIGRYSHAALDEGSRAITDHQYYELLFETGVIGFAGYMILFAFIFIKGLKNMKCNLFELGILSFYLIAMLGADCLSSPAMHSVVFWICCGRILNKNCLSYKERYNEVR